MTKSEKIQHLCKEILEKGFEHAARHIQAIYTNAEAYSNGFKDGARALTVAANCRAEGSRDSQYGKENARVAGFYRRAAQILRGP